MSDSQTDAFVEVNSHGSTLRLPLRTLCRVGRSADNDIVLDDPAASRNHAILYSADGSEFYLNDLASSNGTLVNQTRVVAPTLLHDGDRIGVGTSELVFHQPSGRESKTLIPLGATGVLISQRLITVLVVDIRGFTRLARRMKAEKLSNVTGELVRESGRALQGHGAVAQKYIGDAVMAIWEHSASPRREELLWIFDALSKVVAIADRLQLQFALTQPVRVGAGINTGLASVGNLGSVAASDYTALGDTVNMAFGLESATKDSGFDLLLGPGTHETIRAELPELESTFEPRLVVLKGYDGPTKAFGTRFDLLTEAMAKKLGRGDASRSGQ